MTRSHLSSLSSVHDADILALKTLAILPTSLAGAVTLWVGTRCALAVGIVAIVHSWELRDAPYKKFGIGIPTKSLALVSWYHCCHRIKGKGVAVGTSSKALLRIKCRQQC